MIASVERVERITRVGEGEALEGREMFENVFEVDWGHGGEGEVGDGG